MSSNRNGLWTTVQVAATANTEESSFFVLRGNPTYIENLTADTITANTIVGSEVDAETQLVLNNQTITATASDLLLNGVPVGGGGGDPSGWAQYPAVQNVDLSGFRILKLGTPTNASDATTKAYVDGVAAGITPSNWSAYPATQDVNFAGFQQSNVQFINAVAAADNPVFIYNPYALGGTTTTSPNVLIAAGGENRTDISNSGVGIATQKNITRGIVDTGVGELIGTFTTFGKDLADNDIPYAGIRGICVDPSDGYPKGRLNLVARDGPTNRVYMQVDASANTVSIQGNSGTTLDMAAHKLINLATPTNASDAATKAYVDAAQIAGSSNWANYAAVSNVNMSGFAITNIAGLSNTTGTINMVGDDVNIQATGLTSVLNMNSVFGTLIASVGAVDITAGGLTTINSTGNISIGSLGTTSIENFNLSNSVLTKVPATADLELNNIATITNTAANIDISAANVRIDNFNVNGSVLTKLAGAADLQLSNISRVVNNTANIDISSSQVNVNSFQFAGSNLSAPGATRLFLDDVEAINNDAVGGAIDITADTVRVNDFLMTGATLNTNSSNFTLNNIEKLNLTTGGSVIDSYATINAVGTGLTDAVGFKATTLTANSGTAVGFYSDTTEASASASIAAGFAALGTTANNTDGNAVGVQVQTVLGGATSGTATGVEVAGTMTGATKRGFWEHSASAGVVNTFVHSVGIGQDPNTSYALDVAGRVHFVQTVGGSNNQALILENTSDTAEGSFLEFYHNSATPAANDKTGVITFRGEDTSPAEVEYGRIRNVIQNPATGAHSGMLDFYVANAGTTKEYMHIDGSGNDVSINPNANIAGGLSFKIFDSQGVATNNTLMNADCSNANVMFKNYPQRYIYDISGNYTLTLPHAFNAMRIVAFGAGGGGGSGRKGTTSCFGGGAGAGGNGVELWYDRQELLPDASGSITLYITPGAGGAGGAAVSTAATNGNNGANGGTTYVNLDAFGAGGLKRMIPDTATSGGNGGSGGTTIAGTGGTAPTFSSDRNIGSQGRSGASSSITAQPVRNTTALLYNGSVYSQTGGSGAGGGIDSAGTTQYAGGIFVSPCGQKYNGLGANVNKGGAAGTAGGTPGGNGGIVSFDQLTTAAVRPLAGMCSLMAGGGASIGGNGGTGGSWTAGTAGSRGDGGGGGGATGNAGVVPSGAGGRGADGFVYITVW